MDRRTGKHEYMLAGGTKGAGNALYFFSPRMPYYSAMSLKKPEEWDPPHQEMSPEPAIRERQPLFSIRYVYQRYVLKAVLIFCGIFFLLLITKFYFWWKGNDYLSGITEAVIELFVQGYMLFMIIRAWLIFRDSFQEKKQEIIFIFGIILFSIFTIKSIVILLFSIF